MGALNRSDTLDATWLEKCKRVGRVWLIIDERVEDRMEKDSMDTMKISFKQRPGGWLVIMEGLIAGTKQVQFKDIASMADAGNVVKGMLEEPQWKPSKPYDQNRTKPNTDKTA